MERKRDDEGDVHPLQSINESAAHRLTLQLWEKEELVLNRRIEQKESRCRNIQNEIYNLMGLYFVFLGVVLTAVFSAATQPNTKTCKCWWSPFALTAIALVGTVSAVHHKFHLQWQMQNLLEEEKQNSRALFRCIDQLRNEGAKYELGYRIPVVTERAFTAKKPWEWNYLWGYRGAVTLILIAFSAIVMVSCRVTLCLR